MNPGPRSQERFFSALPDYLPVEQLTHVHLVHQDPDQPSPIVTLRQHDFSGCVVAARASIVGLLETWSDMPRVLHDHPTAEQPAGHVLLELPQGKQATRLAIQQALSVITPPGRLWIYGVREHGIHSLIKKYPSARVVMVKGHMRLLSLGTEALDTTMESSTIDPFHRMVHGGLQWATLPGVFSWREPDEGSLLLLEAMGDHDPGRKVLDWGCGYGLLGVTLAHRWPHSELVLADDQYAAIRAAHETLRCNGLDGRVCLVLENGIGRELSRSTFNTIITNPPFHRGARNEHGPTMAFFHQIAPLLQPGGQLWFVSNSFLVHDRTLQQCGFTVEKVVQTNRFTVCRGWKTAKLRGDHR